MYFLKSQKIITPVLISIFLWLDIHSWLWIWNHSKMIRLVDAISRSIIFTTIQINIGHLNHILSGYYDLNLKLDWPEQSILLNATIWTLIRNAYAWNILSTTSCALKNQFEHLILDFLDDGTEYYSEHALSKMVSNRSFRIWGGVLLRLDKIRNPYSP